jgi:hypothetical protein
METTGVRRETRVPAEAREAAGTLTTTGTATAHGWAWRWTGWASWPVSPAILWVAGAAVGIDVVSAWLGQPEWYLGRVLVSPALPLAALLVLLVGLRRLGASRAGVLAWREFLVVTGLGIVLAATTYARTVSGWREIEGVALTAFGEEVVYRLGAVLLVGAACARLAGRNWRDTAAWGAGPVAGGLVGGAVVFSLLPGHVSQMTGVGNVVPFASLAVLLGYSALRTGSLVPAVAVHILLDLVALAFFAGALDATARLVAACAVLVVLAAGLMPAGRRLGLRSRTPAVIDLR